MINFVLDVESVGLYGEGFAVAFVVTDATGNILDQKYIDCQPETARGEHKDLLWVKEFVCPFLPPNIELDCESESYSIPYFVRRSFWKHYLHWRNQGAIFWADCIYPVETSFFRDCIIDDPENRKHLAPYPLNDIATVRLCRGLNSTQAYDLPDNKKHNPIHECRYIADKLIKWLDLEW